MEQIVEALLASIARRGRHGTLWPQRHRSRVHIKDADGSGGQCTWTAWIRCLRNASPGRFVSGIHFDPANPNHAWISYSGYVFNPGHHHHLSPR